MRNRRPDSIWRWPSSTSTTSGAGSGELAPAATVKLNDAGAIQTQDYGAEVVRLTNVQPRNRRGRQPRGPVPSHSGSGVRELVPLPTHARRCVCFPGADVMSTTHPAAIVPLKVVAVYGGESVAGDTARGSRGPRPGRKAARTGLRGDPRRARRRTRVARSVADPLIGCLIVDADLDQSRTARRVSCARFARATTARPCSCSASAAKYPADSA